MDHDGTVSATYRVVRSVQQDLAMKQRERQATEVRGTDQRRSLRRAGSGRFGTAEDRRLQGETELAGLGRIGTAEDRRLQGQRWPESAGLDRFGTAEDRRLQGQMRAGLLSRGVPRRNGLCPRLFSTPAATLLLNRECCVGRVRRTHVWGLAGGTAHPSGDCGRPWIIHNVYASGGVRHA